MEKVSGDSDDYGPKLMVSFPGLCLAGCTSPSTCKERILVLGLSVAGTLSRDGGTIVGDQCFE